MCDDPGSPFISAVLEVPGMKVDQLSVRIEHGRLVVEGERNGPTLHVSPVRLTQPVDPSRSSGPTPGPTAGAATSPSVPPSAEEAGLAALYPVRELKYGKFRREIPLPAGVNVSVPPSLSRRRVSVPTPCSVCMLRTRVADGSFLAGCARPQHARGRHALHFVAARPRCARRGAGPDAAGERDWGAAALSHTRLAQR